MKKNYLYLITAASIALWTTVTFALPLPYHTQEREHLWSRCQQQAETIYQASRVGKIHPGSFDIKNSVDFSSYEPIFPNSRPLSAMLKHWDGFLNKYYYPYRADLYYIDNQIGLNKSHFLNEYPDIPESAQYPLLNKCVACCAWKIYSASRRVKTLHGVCAWVADHSKIWPLVGSTLDHTTLRGNYCLDRLAPALATGNTSHGDKLNPKRNEHFPDMEKN